MTKTTQEENMNKSEEQYNQFDSFDAKWSEAFPNKKKSSKTKKVSSKKKKKLIKAIKNEARYFKFEFTRYGGEVCMGTITSAQFEYWYNNENFEQYMVDVDYDPDNANKDVPKDAQFDRPFHEQDDIAHLCGPELANGNTLYITELDDKGNPKRNQEGNGTVEDIKIDFDLFKKKGVKTKCVAVHNEGSKTCKDTHYMFGQYFNKGGWYTEDLIKTGPEGINLKKIKINYEDCDGFKVFSEVEYDGQEYYLQEDSVGKSSSFYVMEGDDV